MALMREVYLPRSEVDGIAAEELQQRLADDERNLLCGTAGALVAGSHVEHGKDHIAHGERADGEHVGHSHLATHKARATHLDVGVDDAQPIAARHLGGDDIVGCSGIEYQPRLAPVDAAADHHKLLGGVAELGIGEGQRVAGGVGLVDTQRRERRVEPLLAAHLGYGGAVCLAFHLVCQTPDGGCRTYIVAHAAVVVGEQEQHRTGVGATQLLLIAAHKGENVVAGLLRTVEHLADHGAGKLADERRHLRAVGGIDIMQVEPPALA